MAQMTALHRRMIDDMTVRNLSPATQQSYVYAVAKFSRFSWVFSPNICRSPRWQSGIAPAELSAILIGSAPVPMQDVRKKASRGRKQKEGVG